MKIEAIQPLEQRSLLAPVLSIFPRTALFTAGTAPTPPPPVTVGRVDVTLGTPDAGFLTDAPFSTVTELTPISSFGGDIVRIRSGPGGDFGKGVYAISRGAGENAANTPPSIATLPSTVNGAVNRPGVIYRVDPTTGKTSVFFDLNTVAPQLDPTATPGNSVGKSTGLVNWYDMTFDPEGYFDGRPSMFVASVDRSNPAKNAVYRIAPDGSFMGAFVQFTNGQSALKFTLNPSAVLVPPPEDQTFLRGLIAGGGVATDTGNQFAALFFDSNAYRPGQNISTATLPAGVSQTGLTLGAITGLTASNPDYFSRVYSSFTDFGTPAGPGIPATNGLSGVQGINGELLIGNTLNAGQTATSTAGFLVSASTDSTLGDRVGAIPSNFRRFEDIAFDQYGYFAQGANITPGAATGGGGGGTGTGGGSTGGTGAGGGSGTGAGTAGAGPSGGYVIVNNVLTRPGILLPPANAGNLFVADLATGLSVPVPVAPTNPVTPGQPTTIRVPVQGPENIVVTNGGAGNIQVQVTPTDVGLGGRIVRITPTGVVRNFAENFHTSNAVDSSGFALSSLSITFSADGTTLYAADDDGIWQFKTVASLAGSQTGSLTGLNDLRSLGVPYEGQDSAVAVIDTGVDANNPNFRGRVARGTNVFTNGFGNDDTSIFGNGQTTNTGTGGGSGGGNGGNGGNTTNPAPLPTADGHGTPVAGVVAQFVPQATIVPINIFAPFLVPTNRSNNGGTGGTGGGGGNGAGTNLAGNSNALTNSQFVYSGLGWLAAHPFVYDPIRPAKTDRVIAATLGFGSTNTFDSEGSAYRLFPQVTIALKNQIKKFRSLGIAPIAAAGQFGAPFAAGVSNAGTGGNGGNGGNGGGGAGTTTGLGNNNFDNAAVGDNSGMSLPAVLNEVTSVTGSYAYPFAAGPDTPPTNPPVGVVPRPLIVPVLVFGNQISIGGNATTGGNGGNQGGGGNGGTNATFNALPTLLANADFAQYTDRLLGSNNRSVTTDFVAPAINVPTFRRTFVLTTGTTGGGGGGGGGGGLGGGGGGAGGGGSGVAAGTTGDPNDHNAFNVAGTSMSAAEVTGAFALVSSALNYWANLQNTGVTSDAYLTQPVGARTLNFGPHAFLDLTKYNNPDGINSILQWTAVPANDPNDALSASTPQNEFGSTNFRNYSRISVSNAIAAIEGAVALNYLIAHNDLQYIDGNKNGIISAQEVQNFVDNAAKMGMPEAGAMARFLGGTARTPVTVADNPYGLPNSVTLFDESPDQPDVLQRRFNFFDYAADGNLNGSVTIDQLNYLAHILLPTPDAFVVNDRQRSSVLPYLLAPTTQRNYHDLEHIKPGYEFIPKSALRRYQNVSPARFHVDRGLPPSSNQFPLYTLYDGPTRLPSRSSSVSNLPAGGGSTGSGGTTGTGSSATGGAPLLTATTPAAVPNLAAAAPQTTAVQSNTQTGTTTPGGVLNVGGGGGPQAVMGAVNTAIQNASGSGGTTVPTTTATDPNAAGTTSTSSGVNTTTQNTAVLPPSPIPSVAAPVVNAATSLQTAPGQVAPVSNVSAKSTRSKSFLQRLFG